MACAHEKWKVAWIEAYIWWCGDDICDCTQPVVECITPNLKAGYPWINRERLWSGTFKSEREVEEKDLQEAELKEAAERYEITLDKNYGRRLG